MDVFQLPVLNAGLNALCLGLLTVGYLRIRQNDRQGHQRAMTSACVVSTIFLGSYLTYHYTVGSVPYPHHDWTRPLYFSVLVPHVILAAGMLPLVAAALLTAWKGNFSGHRRIVKWLWPVWVYVSLSGVVVYFMLYHT